MLRERAGVSQGDVIVELNRQPVQNINDFQRLSGKLGTKDAVLLLIARQGGRMFVAINP